MSITILKTLVLPLLILDPNNDYRSIEIRNKRIVLNLRSNFKLTIRFNNINTKFLVLEKFPDKLVVEWFENSRVDSMMGGRELIKMRSHAACRPPGVYFSFSLAESAKCTVKFSLLNSCSTMHVHVTRLCAES